MSVSWFRCPQTPLESLVMGGVSKIMASLVTYPSQVSLVITNRVAIQTADVPSTEGSPKAVSFG